MKKLICCLIFLSVSHGGCSIYIGPDWSGISSAYAMDFSAAAKEAALKTNEELADEIEEILNIVELKLFVYDNRDLNYLRSTNRSIFELTARNNRIAYQLDTTGYLFGGLFKLGIAYWGFAQNSRYGNVTGGLFALSGIVQLFRIQF